MPENTQTFTTTVEQSKTTENYAVYDGPDLPGGQQLAGLYASLAAFGGSAEDAPEYLTVTVGDEEQVPLAFSKTNGEGKSVQYESESGAISGMYVWPDRIGSDVFGTAESEETVREPSITLAVASEEDFEAIIEEAENDASEEAENLLADAGSEDEVDVEAEREDEAEDLLEEAADAA